VLINSYVEQRKVGWDFEDESPGRDARGYGREGSQAPEIETHLVNTVLTNGARYYVDHAHPEYSTPECANALELVLADKAGERILARSMQAAARILEPGQSIVVYKNNSDGKGNSYGCHENYLVDRALPFSALVRHLLPWFVTRQVFTGAGKVGSENGAAPVDYQISQRADFFEEEVGLETTLKRPIVNTRDEPHADPQLYRRLHVIAGDANLCEVATFLKVGTTAIVLAMIEDNFLDSAGARKDWSLAGPVQAMRVVSHDPTCRATVELADGASMTAIELQWEFLRLAQKYADETGLEACGGETVGGDVLARWEAVLSTLERDPGLLEGQLDWVTKFALLDAYAARDGLSWDDPKLALLDLQYHDVRPQRSLYERLVRAGKVERLVEESDVLAAINDPPGSTRAYFRGTCLARWPEAVVAANWDSLILDIGGDPLKRIPMMEPLRGTKAHVGPLFATVDTPGELVARLAL
jgi:proteasome accessory factor A